MGSIGLEDYAREVQKMFNMGSERASIEAMHEYEVQVARVKELTENILNKQ